MRNFVRGAIAALALGASGLAAQNVALAADLPSYKAPPPPAFIEPPFHPFQVRLKVGGVVPLDGTATFYDNGIVSPGLAGVAGTPWVGPVTGLSAGYGGVVTGASTSISSAVIPMLDVAYYFTRNWAVEAICCVTPHQIQGTGTLTGGTVARTWVFPPSLLLQYHFTNFGAFQPYLGVGVNFTTFWGTRAGNNSFPLPFPNAPLGIQGAAANLYSVRVSPSWGVVGQAGADYMFNDHWGVNVDVKYIMMEPNAQAWGTAFLPGAAGGALNPIYVPVNVGVKINPIVVSAGLTYRFGGDWGVPKLLPF